MRWVNYKAKPPHKTEIYEEVFSQFPTYGESAPDLSSCARESPRIALTSRESGRSTIVKSPSSERSQIIRESRQINLEKSFFTVLREFLLIVRIKLDLHLLYSADEPSSLLRVRLYFGGPRPLFLRRVN